MVEMSWNMQKNKLANSEMGEGDFGWTWIIKMWELIAQNPIYLEGTLEENVSIVGIIDEEDISGAVA